MRRPLALATCLACAAISTPADASVPPQGKYNCFEGPGYNFVEVGRLIIKAEHRYRWVPHDGDAGGGKLIGKDGKRFKVKNGPLGEVGDRYYPRGRWFRDDGEVRISLRPPATSDNPYRMGCSPV